MTTPELRELFGDDLAPALRRLGERDRGAGAKAAPDPADAQTRTAVWDTLAGAGALARHRQTDLVEVAEMMGGALYQSPWADTLLAAELLERTATFTDGALSAALRDGGCPVAVALREHGTCDPSEPGPVRVEGHTVTGTRRFVAFAPDSALLALVGRDGDSDSDSDEIVLALVAPDAPGVRVRRQDDLGRGDLYEVTFTAAPVHGGVVHRVTDHYADALARARIRWSAYLAGAARGGTELAVGHLTSRRAFGRTLAQQQALAYRLAALSAETAAVRAFAEGCARAADTGADVRQLAAQLLALAGELAGRTAAESVHLHGALGMTEGSDAQLFYRRAAIDAQWLGGRTSLLREAGRLLASARSSH
ncbi:acyl-CoA dehydrogenase family protein [Streptomyces sp. NPDC005438]|uniref:acyl-CoA dehydrogenase family protein n=1 Tax=Streptomyces sp. NPDC005438 TaxID=3156880 RepID=UPI0033B1C159